MANVIPAKYFTLYPRKGEKLIATIKIVKARHGTTAFYGDCGARTELTLRLIPAQAVGAPAGSVTS
jgi:hypothetical protein